LRTTALTQTKKAGVNIIVDLHVLRPGLFGWLCGANPAEGIKIKMLFDRFRKNHQQAPSPGGKEVVDMSVDKPVAQDPPKLSSDQMLIQSIKKFRDEMRNVASQVVIV